VQAGFNNLTRKGTECCTRVKSLVELDSCSMRRSGRRYGVPFPVTHSKPNLEFGICKTAKV
jgi:hypothetical protein